MMRAIAVVLAATTSFARAQAPDVTKPDAAKPDARAPAPDATRPVTPAKPAPGPMKPVGVNLPPIPTFELPTAEPGFVDVRALRIRSKTHLDKPVKVKGYVTFVYDCVQSLVRERPGLSARRAQRLIDKDPTVCSRPHLSLGAARDAPEHQTIRVVDVPRPPTKAERRSLPKEELAAWPDVPALAVGDYVSITGTWALSSPKGERDSGGLLIYASLVKTQPAAAPPAATSSPTPAAEPLPPVPARVAARPVDARMRHGSLRAVARGNEALAARQLDDAIAAYREAVTAWDGNHTGWYALGVASVHKRDWTAARDAWERAVHLAPDSALYLMWYGIAAYEAAPEQARDRARAMLRLAIDRDARLARAHYYLGRIERDLDRPREAATAFSRAIAANPAEAGPYVALAELYRRWGYLELARAAAFAGTAHVRAGASVSEIWYVLGTIQEDAKLLDPAIDAFGKALEARPDNHKARFARGAAYARKGDAAKARRDLEDFVKLSDAGLELQKVVATKLLGELAVKR